MRILQRRLSGVAWLWCLLHTAVVPEPARSRRRTEVLGHLWESECVGIRSWRVLSATARGAGDDVTWALRLGGPALLAAPASWVAVAAALPVSAFLGSAVVEDPTANMVERLALLGSLTFLAFSALLWVRRRD